MMKWVNNVDKLELIAFFLIEEHFFSIAQKIKLFYLFGEDIEIIRKTSFSDLSKEAGKKKNIGDLNWDHYLHKSEQLLKHKDIKIITKFEEDYPFKAVSGISGKLVNKPSPVIFYKGDLDLLKKKREKYVSIVGTRTPLDIAESMTRKITRYYSVNDYVIVSGFARGIDRITHEEALKNRGSTIAILGCGVDVVYPVSNFHLYAKMIKNNALILSEFPPQTRPMKQNFPFRNRLIALLGEKVYLIQAGYPSGGLITIKYSLDFNKKIYIYDQNYKHCFAGNKLLIDSNPGVGFHFFSKGESLNFSNRKKMILNEENIEKKILMFIYFYPYCNFNLIQEELGLPYPSLINSIMRLIQKGKINWNNEGEYFPKILNISRGDIANETGCS